jgi:hypothetical protein
VQEDQQLLRQYCQVLLLQLGLHQQVAGVQVH